MRHSALPAFLALTLAGCPSGSSDDDDAVGDGTFETSDCTDLTGAEEVVCAANNFLATLTDAQLESVGYGFSNSEAKTLWSNLPGVERTGLTRGELSDESIAALGDLAATVLSGDGYEDYVGLLAADDYLGAQGGGGGGPGGGSGQYAASNYIVSFFGTPAVDSDWMMQLGGHHMAYNITFLGTEGYPTPNHLGAEPKGSFTVDSESYDPLSPEGDAWVALFAALSSTELTESYISGQFADILLGPVEYGSGSLSAVTFPTGSNRDGKLVSELSTAQQALVTEVISQWVEDYNPIISAPLMSDYTSAEAFADTYVAWGGSSSTPDIEVSGTYFRLDGPRVWIEVACQNGVILSGTHFHTIYRDEEYDYGGAL